MIYLTAEHEIHVFNNKYLKCHCRFNAILKADLPILELFDFDISFNPNTGSPLSKLFVDSI